MTQTPKELATIINRNIYILWSSTPYTPTQLSAQLNISDRTLARYLAQRTRRLPRLDILLKIAKYFDLSIIDLLTPIPDKKIKEILKKGGHYVS